MNQGEVEDVESGIVESIFEEAVPIFNVYPHTRCLRTVGSMEASNTLTISSLLSGLYDKRCTTVTLQTVQKAKSITQIGF